MVKQWNQLPWDAEFLSVEILKTQLDMVLSNLLKQSQLEQGGWIMWSQEAPSNLNDSVTPCSPYSFKPWSHSSWLLLDSHFKLPQWKFAQLKQV